MLRIWNAFTRRKPIEKEANENSQLNRCIGTIDLTALGIGSTLGVGVYVITGIVAATQSGPSVILSFIIAAVSSIFAGLCYAEFGARVPRAGSAYIYSYVSVGELMAFVIGWNLILEYVIGTASVARAYSNYVDFLFNGAIEGFLKTYLHIPKTAWFSDYPDIFAFSLTMLLAVILMVGVKESTKFNTFFTCVNFLIILYCVIVGLFKVDLDNWRIQPDQIPPDYEGGKGGFFPFGISGMIAGAATCFYSFVGFDAIATTGEEVINPQRAIPLSIILSLSFVTLAYCSVSAVQTLLWPYYDQNNKASLPFVFDKVGYTFAKKVITVGALAGLSTSLLGAMFPLPRVLYAMANDGLIFKFLGSVNPRFKTPLWATLVAGLFSATMAMFFDVDELAEMMSIGTLLAYSLVALSILILRYQNPESYTSINASGASNETVVNRKPFLSRLFNIGSQISPDAASSRMSFIILGLIMVFIFALNIMMIFFEESLYGGTIKTLPAVFLVVIFAFILFFFGCLYRQPQIQSEISFEVPLVPFIPLLSIFSNLYLMVHLNYKTWYRFVVWMFIGFVIYFSYGIVKSVGYLTETEKNRLELDAPSLPQSFENEGYVEDQDEGDVLPDKHERAHQD